MYLTYDRPDITTKDIETTSSIQNYSQLTAKFIHTLSLFCLIVQIFSGVGNEKEITAQPGL